MTPRTRGVVSAQRGESAGPAAPTNRESGLTWPISRDNGSSPIVSEGPAHLGSSRLARISGYLAILFGVVGAFAGVSGAATFIPYRGPDALSLETAMLLTAISAIGAAVSILAVAAGVALLRSHRWARRAALGFAVSAVAVVGMFALSMPSTSPSPVPGGPGPFVFLAVVAAAYGLVIVLLLASAHFGGRPRGTAAD